MEVSWELAVSEERSDGGGAHLNPVVLFLSWAEGGEERGDSGPVQRESFIRPDDS
jgi:hypothetical protein